MTKEINVHIGEVKIAKHGEVLKAILGSCIGIGFIWRAKNIYGLAHCLLPESKGLTFQIGGRFVNQAIPSLIAMMKIKPDDIEHIEAIVAGGGNMTSPKKRNESELVGAWNYRVAKSELKKLGIRVVLTDVGGEEGRRVTINGATGEYHVERIPRIIAV